MDRIIDAHIHLDHYSDEEIAAMAEELPSIHCEKLISVSFDLESCKRNLHLAQTYSHVSPAFGFHPEQELPSEEHLADLLAWMESNREKMCAIGEIGLPYYSQVREKKPYVELLDAFLQLANKWNKPVALHAIYEDASIACDLLERNNVKKAHFHWFKGDETTISRMIENAYHISITPDLLYEPDIQELVRNYPLEQMMVETDGPWQFEGIFTGKRTHPAMIHETIPAIANLKKENTAMVYQTLYNNTKKFYGI